MMFGLFNKPPSDMRYFGPDGPEISHMVPYREKILVAMRDGNIYEISHSIEAGGNQVQKLIELRCKY